MNLLYKSTRNSDKTVTASQAILKGLADDGGLFVPVSVPKLDVTMDELKDMIFAGTIQDSKTISAVLAYDALLNRKKNN